MGQKYNWEILDKGYFDEKGYLRKDLVVNEAEKIGKLFAQGSLNRYDKNNTLSSSQLRNFFNEVKALDARVEEDNFEENLPFILMLKSKASYAYRGGKSSKIPASFYEFLEKNVEVIQKRGDIDTFKGFVDFFETVVGYFYGHGGDKN